jgi:hypothetical protein
MGRGASRGELSVSVTGRDGAARPSAALKLIDMASAALPVRALPFRAVNCSDAPDYNPFMQRHHLLPRQLLDCRCFGPLFDRIGRERLCFDDFRTNGLLLPASDSMALRIGLPLHRGPHRNYNALVMERMGQVEQGWASQRARAPEVALSVAAERITLLQRALRRRLLNPRGGAFVLNRFDPLRPVINFAEMDAMVDSLWSDTQVLRPTGSVFSF